MSTREQSGGSQRGRMDLYKARRIGAYVVRPMSEDRSWWTRVGSAFVNRDGSISIKLDALPIGDAQGQATLILREDREESQG